MACGDPRTPGCSIPRVFLRAPGDSFHSIAPQPLTYISAFEAAMRLVLETSAASYHVSVLRLPGEVG
jgi:hypothetical protein